MTETSRITPTIGLDAPGRRTGFLNVPWSRDDSAWGAIRIPIAVVRGGEGPTLLLTAGNHGDEYEGQIALRKLLLELEPEALAGRVIVLPSMNHPAVLAGRRVSPIDGGNMNRSFPGRRDGSPTAMIAHYVYHELVARADIVVDLHSGGRTLDFVPSACMHELADQALEARTRDALMAFGAPVALVLEELDTQGLFDSAVEELGKLFVTTELGGGGSTTPERLAITERGVRNLLCHFGLLAGSVTAPERPPRFARTPGEGFIVADHAGLLEPLVELGATVDTGQPLCRIHGIDDVGGAPVTCTAPCRGFIYARHFPGLVKRGDCVAVIAVEEALP